MAEKPGIVFYYDVVLPIVKYLSREQLGEVFAAAVEYGQTGALPELDDLSLFAFETLRPHIDRDAAKYAEKCRKNRYKRYLGVEKAVDREPLDYETWITVVDRSQPQSTTATNINMNYNTTTTGTGKITTTQLQQEHEHEREEEKQGGAGGRKGETTPDLFFRGGRYVKIVDGHEREADEREIEAFTQRKKQEARKAAGYDG